MYCSITRYVKCDDNISTDSERLAIDVWSAGIVLLFFLCGKFPLFAATSDLHATMELAVILGKDAMEKTAALHSELLC